MIRFVEVVNNTVKNPRMERTAIPSFSLGEIWINEEYVINIREAQGYTRMLHEGVLPPDLDESHRFTAVTVNEGGNATTHVVVGDAPTVARRISQDRSQLLKG